MIKTYKIFPNGNNIIYLLTKAAFITEREHLFGIFEKA